MGFNRGQGLEFTPLPLSSDENQINIDENSGTPSTLGRFIYEVSGTTITRGGCASGGLIAGTTVRSVTFSSFRSGTVNSNTVNSKFHLILSFFEFFVKFL